MDNDPIDGIQAGVLIGARFGDTAIPDGVLLAALRARDGSSSLRDAALSLFLDQIAVDRGISVSNEELQKALHDFRAARALGKRADMMAWLKHEGFDEDSFADKLERDVRREKLKNAVVPDSEIERRFLSYRFAQQKACLSRIVVSDFGRAEEIRDRVIEGEVEFQHAAMTYSEDVRDRRSGGYLDWQARSQLADIVAGAVFSARPGDVVGPIEDGAVFTIFKIWETDAVVLDPVIRAALRDEIFAEWCQEQAERANISFAPTS